MPSTDAQKWTKYSKQILEHWVQCPIQSWGGEGRVCVEEFGKHWKQLECLLKTQMTRLYHKFTDPEGGVTWESVFLTSTPGNFLIRKVWETLTKLGEPLKSFKKWRNLIRTEFLAVDRVELEGRELTIIV